jgi:hypothetical protein
VSVTTVGGMPHPPYVPPVVRAPLVRSQIVTGTSVPSEADMPRAARTWLHAARRAGWVTHVTYALGWEVTLDGEEARTPIKEPTGEETPTGRAAMTTTGYVQRDPVPSYLVRCGRDAFFASGLWVDGKWDSGFTYIRGEGLRAHSTAKAVKDFMAEVNGLAESSGSMSQGELLPADLT